MGETPRALSPSPTLNRSSAEAGGREIEVGALSFRVGPAPLHRCGDACARHRRGLAGPASGGGGKGG
ncbi:hypothetical protein PR202_ga25089 [Eleusine coracana subsp. coracana]|uniref:Uncharacterized protein n=1 Tax=Eleusine coracana subsp. coracana TaxID=191504 RepID=A0AAV5DBB3_ELECO|nr:hypothetical protein PR202_ga25089 [Eleusine coracana subsp. coracana]